MKTTTALLAAVAATVVTGRPTVDNRFPYTGPDVPVGDWVDPTVNGNGKGFPRLVEPPAVKPSSANPTNNVNVISLSYLPRGIHIHYQTPFGLGDAPQVKWGKHPHQLNRVARGFTHTYVRVADVF
jgi:acid phosphatase